jgi:hypothetical protein
VTVAPAKSRSGSPWPTPLRPPSRAHSSRDGGGPAASTDPRGQIGGQNAAPSS